MLCKYKKKSALGNYINKKMRLFILFRLILNNIRYGMDASKRNIG